MRRTRTYKLFRNTKTKVLNITASLIMVASSLGSALPVVLSQRAIAATPAIDHIAFTTPAQTVTAGNASDIITIQTQNHGDQSSSLNTSNNVLTITSDSGTGKFAETSGSTWSTTGSFTMANGTANRSFVYEDSVTGVHTLTAALSADSGAETWSATQQIAITTPAPVPVPATRIHQGSSWMTDTSYSSDVGEATVTENFTLDANGKITGAANTQLNNENSYHAGVGLSGVFVDKPSSNVNQYDITDGTDAYSYSDVQLDPPSAPGDTTSGVELWAKVATGSTDNWTPQASYDKTYTLTWKAGNAVVSIETITLHVVNNSTTPAPADTTGPAINFTNPTRLNDTSYNKYFAAGPNITITASDPSGIENTSLHIYKSDNTPEKYCPLTTSDTTSCDTSSLAEGDYFVKAAANDNAGNPTYVTKYFSIDTTKPNIHLDSPSDNFYKNGHNFTVSGTASDAASGIDHVSIYVAHDPWGDGGYVVDNQTATYDANAGTFSYDASNIPDGSYVVKAIAYDNVGNVRYANAAHLTVDNVKPSLTIKSPATDWQAFNSTAASPLTITGTASDSLSGLDDSTLSVALGIYTDAGNHVQKVVNVCRNFTWNGDTFTCTVSLTDSAMKQALADGKYVLHAGVKDKAGNSLFVNRFITVDSTPPVLTVKNATWNNPSVVAIQSGSTVSTLVDSNLRLFTTETNIDTILLDGSSEWSGSWLTNGGGVGISFITSGTHTFQAVDQAGNVSDLITLTFDNIAPTGTFTYSNNNGNALTKDDVTVTLTTSEEVQDISGWTRDSINPLQFTKVFTDNGTFSVDFTDLAGNPGTATGTVKRIDRQAPTISGVSDGDVVTGPVSLSIFDPVYEGYFGFDALHGLTINGVETPTVEAAGHTFTAAEITADGTYTVIATDKAGNQTQLTFTIDSQNLQGGEGGDNGGTPIDGGTGGNGGIGGPGTLGDGGNGGQGGFTNNFAQVLGASTTASDTPSDTDSTSDSGQVKGDTIDLTNNNQSKKDLASSNAFFGLGWWWLAVLAALLALWLFVAYRRSDRD